MNVTRPATIKDVAAAAQVSTATVSKFVNGQQSFSREVEDRLRSAIERLGYRQNPAARSIATGRTGAVGLAALDICNLHHVNVIKGANKVALSESYSLLIVDIEDQPDMTRQVLETLALRVDGLVVSSRIPDSVIDWLARLGKPVVYVGWPPKDGAISVRTDSLLAGRMLGTHLSRQGCRRIAYIGYEPAAWNHERLRGLKEAAAAEGGEVVECFAEAMTTEAGEQALPHILFGSEKFDAVVGCNDVVAIGLLLQARAMGLRVPDDICVAGFDNIEPSRYVGLTTIDMASRENGERAMQCVLRLIRGEAPHIDAGPSPRLVTRDSTRRIPSTQF